jgi:hypothetical protein
MIATLLSQAMADKVAARVEVYSDRTIHTWPVAKTPSDQSIAPSASHFVLNALNSGMVRTIQ